MASKMPAALDENNTRSTISMAERGKCHKPLKCEFCDASVGFVNGFNRALGDDTIAVEPYFRLEKNVSTERLVNTTSTAKLPLSPGNPRVISSRRFREIATSCACWP